MLPTTNRKPDRIACCVPFCRRTRHNRDNTSEWICGPHWMAVAAATRQEKYKAFREYRRKFGDNAYWSYPPGSPQRIECVRADKECERTWEACKQAAIETAAGI